MSKTFGFIATMFAAGAAAHATPVSATVTADNHYAIFTVNQSGLSYVGGNETGAAGSPGTYNWSMAESWAFDTTGLVYIAAWSDDSVAQGVLGQFTANGDDFSSGDARWEVYATGVNRGDGDPHPSVLEMFGHIGDADTGNLWEAPHIGGGNGISPWSTIAGISGEARWMWKNVDGDSDPLQGGSGAGEMLIFRIAVPAPGAMAIFSAGGLVLLRRRR